MTREYTLPACPYMPKVIMCAINTTACALNGMSSSHPFVSHFESAFYNNDTARMNQMVLLIYLQDQCCNFWSLGYQVDYR